MARTQANLTAQDIENQFEIRADEKFNDNTAGTQVLYSEGMWDTIRDDLVADGFDKYSEGYDGYVFYQEVGWPSISSVEAGRGLFTGIPEQGYSGWVCYW